jgi:hypothetical protein
MREWKENLRKIRNGRLQPSHDWVARNRAVLLAQIRNTVQAPDAEKPVRTVRKLLVSLKQAMRLFLPVRLVAVGRSVSIASLAGLLAVGGWIASVSASYGSLPGEALYHVKVAAEKTELLMATALGDNTARVETLLKHAGNRVEEVHNSKTQGQATVAINSLKKSIASANKTLLSAEEKADPAAALMAKVVTQKTDLLLESIETSSSSQSKELGEAAHLIEVAGVRAVEVLVEQNLAGNADVSLEEVTVAVGKKLEKIVTDISRLDDATSSTALMSSSTMPLMASSTIGEMTVSSTTAVTAAEAQTLIDNNDLLGAIKKVQTLTEVKKDAGTAALEAKLNVVPAETATSTPVQTQATTTTTIEASAPQSDS